MSVFRTKSVEQSLAAADEVDHHLKRRLSALDLVVFGIGVITECPGVPAEILVPRETWADPAAYDDTAARLAVLFRENFARYESGADAEVRDGGPRA